MTNEEIVLSPEFDSAVSVFCRYYKIAIEDKTIRKPIAWSLYCTWKVFNRKEKDRSDYSAGTDSV